MSKGKKLFSVLVITIFCELTQASSYIWLEKPSQYNFNCSDKWPTMAGRTAISLKPGKNLPEKPFIEYKIYCKTSGLYEVWGRTFDPVWSSISRWKIDNEKWIPWKPGKCVDRKIYNKTCVMDWCRWGSIELAKGPHTLRFEPVAKRKHGDYHYFIMDVLLLINDPKYEPRGPVSLMNEANIRAKKIRELLKNLDSPMDRAVLQRKLDDALRLAATDTEGLFKLRRLENELMNLNGKIDDRKSLLLNGVFKKIVTKNGVFTYTLNWNRPRAGKTIFYFTQKQICYAVVQRDTNILSEKHIGNFALPQGLPNGKITVYAVPVAEAVSTFPEIFFESSGNGKTIKPCAWGIYRDSSSIVHPWYISQKNMLIWDGEPYIPFGGMINTRLSWIPKCGTPDASAFMDAGEKMLSAKLDYLAAHGIKDIYYNGFFLNSNPTWLRRVVSLTEKKGFRYGLHVSAMPKLLDSGFVYDRKRNIPIQNGIKSFDLNPMTAFFFTDAKAKKRYKAPAIPAGKRVVWVLLDKKNNPVDFGVEKRSANGVFKLKFKETSPNGAILKYLPEMELPKTDPAAYLTGISNHCRQVRNVYGSLKAGPGLRCFIDPFSNEMHTRPTNIPVSGEFRDRFRNFLSERYGTQIMLNYAWGSSIPDIETASKLCPIWSNGNKVLWIDPDNGKFYTASAENVPSLRDFKEFRGKICRDIINQAADALKSVADVPVILKHNTWFSDWFTNDRMAAGGFDGVCMESYCYGDSLAYHNGVVVFGEALQSARRQWVVIGESSAAAFEGQKPYCGYMSRMQMYLDIDQMMMNGAKGFYHFGFMFDPGAGNFYTTDLTRDPRQLEWLTTLSKIYHNAILKFGEYAPSFHGWYPGYLREREIAGLSPRPFDIDGDYTGDAAKIRMAPDGQWILPVTAPAADWKTLLVADPLLTKYQEKKIQRIKSIRLNKNLNSFTASGIGIIKPRKNNPDMLAEFRQNILGYDLYQTSDADLLQTKDGYLIVWTASECDKAEISLPKGAKAFTLEGKEILLQNGKLVMKRMPHTRIKKDFPVHIGGGYYYNSEKQTDVAVIKGTNAAAILKLNVPAFHRWLPSKVKPADVILFREAEDFTRTTFNQPSIVGYSRYSGTRAIGINTKDAPPKGKEFEAEYRFTLSKAENTVYFHLRRMVNPAMNVEILLDGRIIGTIQTAEKPSDRMHLSPWNAGLLKNVIDVGYYTIPVGKITKGEHSLILRAKGISPGYKLDTTLMGGEAQRLTGSFGTNSGMRALQLDCFVLSR